jgi:hypothetical protein
MKAILPHIYDDKKHDILEKLASVRSELARKHNKPMGNLQVIEVLFDKWFGDTVNRIGNL